MGGFIDAFVNVAVLSLRFVYDASQVYAIHDARMVIDFHNSLIFIPPGSC